MLELQWKPPRGYRDNAEPALAHGREAHGVLFQDGLTLALTALTLICVAANVQNAQWVDGVPSLYPIGIAALVAAYALSRVRVNQLLLLPAGVFLGATIVYFELMAFLASGTSLPSEQHQRLSPNLDTYRFDNVAPN